MEKLRAEGFDTRSAEAIGKRYPAERILRQINWIDQRKIKANRLGMLRTAIEQDWSAPGEAAKLGRPNFSRESGTSFQDALRQSRERFSNR